MKDRDSIEQERAGLRQRLGELAEADNARYWRDAEGAAERIRTALAAMRLPPGAWKVRRWDGGLEVEVIGRPRARRIPVRGSPRAEVLRLVPSEDK